MSEQKKKKKRYEIYDLLNAKTKSKFLCLPYTKQRQNFYRKRPFYGKKGIEELTKFFFLTALASAINKVPQNVNKKEC